MEKLADAQAKLKQLEAGDSPFLYDGQLSCEVRRLKSRDEVPRTFCETSWAILSTNFVDSKSRRSKFKSCIECDCAKTALALARARDAAETYPARIMGWPSCVY